MVFVTIFSRPQLNAVLGKLEKEAAQNWGRTPTPPGGRSAWEILDLGDIVVHIMSADMREHYAIEEFYGASEEVALPFLHGPAAASSDGLAGWRTAQ